jgi:hypothetical protein
MKIQFAFFFLLIILLSCHQTETEKKKDILIFGRWGIYETIAFENNDDSEIIKCNVCPEIVFVKDHSGFIKRPDARILPFNWKINGNELKIRHTKKEKDDIMNDGTYQIIPGNKKLHQEIALFDTVKNIKYILNRNR